MTKPPGSSRCLITGAVLDTAGKPVQGATVHLVDGPAPFPDIAALTGSDGGFSFSVPVEGVYTVGCRAPDDTVSQVSAQATAGEPARVEFHVGGT
ncbi:carboxypeptidase-like regulatory domain-containing protein [Streptomyces griseoloalbus]|uniref:carboxypeptidase-like regulatory domain-containing protein n=1 Tax=Streptomyces griseoloalbus TaxID=67303 RepID=UPI0033A38035